MKHAELPVLFLFQRCIWVGSWNHRLSLLKESASRMPCTVPGNDWVMVKVRIRVRLRVRAGVMVGVGIRVPSCPGIKCLFLEGMEN